MSSKDMLGPLTRALVGVPATMLGLLLDIANHLHGKDGKAFYNDLAKFVRNWKLASLVELVVQPAVIPEPMLDFIVRVDRSAKPSYPDLVKKVMHPELEGTGPAEYNLQDEVEQWLVTGQISVNQRGHHIYAQLKKENALKNCLGLLDLLAIQAKDIAVFRALYKGKAVFGWRSVVQDRDGDLFVPYLYDNGDGVGLSWYWLDYYWNSNYPALRFSK